MLRKTIKVLALSVFCALPAAVNAQYIFTTNVNNTISITGYTGSGGDVAVPDSTNGYSITSIGVFAFANSANLTSVMIPGSVTDIGSFAFLNCGSLMSVSVADGVVSIGDYAFKNCGSLTNVLLAGSVTNIGFRAFALCPNLQGVYFQGNEPIGQTYGEDFMFYNDSSAILYYLPGTTGWGPTFGGRPTVLLDVPPPPWNATVQTSDGVFGMGTNGFGFSIIGSSNLVVVVEASTDLADSIWIPLGTNTLNTFVGTNGTSYFSDPQYTNYPARFYRLRSP